MDLVQELKDLKVTKEFFIGIDSDGCVFDTMEIKQKECFCPNVIQHWNLQAVSKYARETWEFVNLYSTTRGCNRFLALTRFVDLLSARKEVKDRGVHVPELAEVRAWTQKESKLGNPALEKFCAENPKNEEMARALKWSVAVNASIADMVFGIPPFPLVKESLEKMVKKADCIVVSQTPGEALTREWAENEMQGFVRMICGQEYGKKSEHLQYGGKGKVPDHKILMIGDAPGDRKAADSNGVLFFPINPGHEEASWEHFYMEGLDRFFTGTFAGEYQETILKEFERYLPENPSW